MAGCIPRHEIGEAHVESAAGLDVAEPASVDGEGKQDGSEHPARVSGPAGLPVPRGKDPCDPGCGKEVEKAVDFLPLSVLVSERVYEKAVVYAKISHSKKLLFSERFFTKLRHRVDPVSFHFIVFSPVFRKNPAFFIFPGEKRGHEKRAAASSALLRVSPLAGPNCATAPL